MCLTDRLSRYSLLITMPNGYAAADALGGLVEGLEQIPAHLRAVDHIRPGFGVGAVAGAGHGYGLEAWFCDPHSPWQRGQVENLNRQWRWWYPRGIDLADISPAEANAVAATSTVNAAGVSATKVPPPSTLHSPCVDHWNWPTRQFSWCDPRHESTKTSHDPG